MRFLQILLTAAVVLGGAFTPQVSEKDSRTPAQQKIDSQLLVEIYRARGEAVPPGETGVRIDTRGRALVDVRAPVTAALDRTIRRLGGVVLSSSASHESVIARVPVLKLETLAADPSVRFIVPAAEGTTTNPHRGE